MSGVVGCEAELAGGFGELVERGEHVHTDRLPPLVGWLPPFAARCQDAVYCHPPRDEKGSTLMESRDARVDARVEPSLHAATARNARERGLSIAAYLRFVLIRATEWKPSDD